MKTDPRGIRQPYDADRPVERYNSFQRQHGEKSMVEHEADDDRECIDLHQSRCGVAFAAEERLERFAD